MKYAHIVPNQLNEKVDKINEMHLLLIHWAMENREYCEFYKKSNIYKMLDNSFYELKRAMPTEELIKWAIELNVDEVVAPDQMFNYKKNKQLIDEFLYEFNKSKKVAQYRQLTGKILKVQAVVCGQTEEEIKQSFIDLLNNQHIHVVSFSRRGQCFPNECNDDARFRMVKWANDYMKQVKIFKPIHLLGANGISDYYRKWPECVRSIDSKQFATAALGKWELDKEVEPIDEYVFTRIIDNLKK